MNMKNEYEKQKVALVSNSSSTKIWKLRDMNKHLNSFGNRIWHWLNLLEEHPKFKPWASGCYFSVQVGGVYHVYIVFNHCIIYKAKILLVIAFSVFTLTLKTFFIHNLFLPTSFTPWHILNPNILRHAWFGLQIQYSIEKGSIYYWE
jgi:hypothetical protein